MKVVEPFGMALLAVTPLGVNAAWTSPVEARPALDVVEQRRLPAHTVEEFYRARSAGLGRHGMEPFDGREAASRRGRPSGWRGRRPAWLRATSSDIPRAVAQRQAQQLVATRPVTVRQAAAAHWKVCERK